MLCEAVPDAGPVRVAWCSCERGRGTTDLRHVACPVTRWLAELEAGRRVQEDTLKALGESKEYQDFNEEVMLAIEAVRAGYVTGTGTGTVTATQRAHRARAQPRAAASRRSSRRATEYGVAAVLRCVSCGCTSARLHAAPRVCCGPTLT